MTNTALITGASSGIGKEFARYHASIGGDVILVARRKPALDALKKDLETTFGITAHVIAQDLGSQGAADTLFQAVQKKKLKVDILVNNAGFGGHGTFCERDLNDDLAMINLNIISLASLTHLFGNEMIKQGGGKLLHVGSTAGFMPGPYQATYFATKAYVNNFSQAIDHEMRPKGVTSTVLCPGYVETEFAATANLDGTSLVKQKGKTAAETAKIGYDAMMVGKLVIVNETGLSIMLNWIVPMLPRRMVLKMIAKMQSK